MHPLKQLERKVADAERRVRALENRLDAVAQNQRAAWLIPPSRSILSGTRRPPDEPGPGPGPGDSHSCGAYSLPKRDWTFTVYRSDGVTVHAAHTATYQVVTISGVEYHTWAAYCYTYPGFSLKYSALVFAPDAGCVEPRLRTVTSGGSIVCPPIPAPSTGGYASPTGHTTSPFELRFGDTHVFR